MVRESASAVTAGGVVQNVKNAPFLKDIEVKEAKYKNLFEENEALVDKYARVRDERKELKVEL